MEPMQSPGLDAPPHRPPIKARLAELPEAHDAVLSTGEIGEPAVVWAC
jgi:hypothetical protein